MIVLSFKLPKTVIRAISACEGAAYTEFDDVNSLDITNSAAGRDVFHNYLATEPDPTKVDPAVLPSFSDPLSPYVPPVTQEEVYNLLRTFQELPAADLRAGGFPFLKAKFPRSMCFSYRHSLIALHAAIQEIQSSNIFAAECPGLASLEPGQVICDLAIIFSNVVVTTRLTKAAARIISS